MVQPQPKKTLKNISRQLDFHRGCEELVENDLEKVKSRTHNQATVAQNARRDLFNI